jgi:hypothetical protein
VIDLPYLKSVGVDSGAYKKIFTLERADMPQRVRKLVDTLSARNRDGITLNLTEWRAFAAIDYAYDVPFNQTTPTLVQHIMAKCGEDGKGLGESEIRGELSAWGLSEDTLFRKGPDGKKCLDVPVLLNIFIPIVKSYSTAVTARIFNERNTVPLFPYRPLKADSERDELLCEIITDRINVTSNDYGYPSVMRQAILQALKYAVCLAFPREQWHVERQEDGPDKENRYIVKEGIRYVIPDPTRMFYDLSHPLTSFNSDTGCEFAAHWSVVRYSDILDNPAYWNRRKITFGTNWMQDQRWAGYQEFFPCQLKFPDPVYRGTLSREDKFSIYNTTNDRDKAVFKTEMFCKINPRTYGLSSYNHPVWHRFVLASDDTVLWCEPFAYNPVWFMGYDHDEQAGRNPSFALELIPWQDLLGQILSQMLLTAQQNLTNATFYDTEMVNKEDVRAFEKLGHGRYSSQNFIPFSSFQRQRAGLATEKAFIPVQLAKAPVGEFMNIMSTVLNLMERVLGISAQEAGAAASHQQSKAEVVQTGGSTNNRRQFTASYIDEGIDAWMGQQYDAHMAFADPSVSAQVSADVPNLEKHLEDLGFKVEHQGKEKWTVSGHKRALDLDGFASRNQGPDVGREKEVSQAVFQLVQTIAGQQDLHQKVGADNLLKLILMASKLAGAPRDLKLKTKPDDGKGGQVDPAMAELLKKMHESILQEVDEKVGKPAAQAAAQAEQQITQLEQAIKGMMPVVQKAQQATDATAIKAKEAAQEMQLDQAKFQAEQARAQQAHQAKLQREQEAAQVKLGIERQKASAEIQAVGVKAAGDVAIAHAQANAPAPNKVSESISYKDAPEEIRAQMEQQAGMTPPTKRTYPKKEVAAKPKSQG